MTKNANFTLKRLMGCLVVLGMLIQIGGISFHNISTFASTKNVITEARTMQTAIYTDGTTYKLGDQIKELDNEVRVPEELNSKFSIDVRGHYNGRPIKFYGGPNENMELNAPGTRPDVITTSDVTVYNGHFIRITDDNGAKLYVDINSADVEVKPITEMMVIGSGDSKQVIIGTRNISMNLTTRTFISPEEIDYLLAGTELEGLGQAIHETELKYGVNAFFIMSVAINESGWGSSWLARNRNNLFGICAYDSNTDAATGFASKAECVDYFGQLISEEYFSRGRTDLYSINAIYASSGHWASNVGGTMSSLANSL